MGPFGREFDLVVGGLIGLYVTREAVEILPDAREAQYAARAAPPI